MTYAHTILSCTLALAGAWAAAGQTQAGSDSGAPPLELAGTPALQQPSVEPLFAEFDTAPAATTLSFRIEVDGRPWLSETLTLAPPAGARAVYELLAHHPAWRQELQRLAGSRGADVRLEASLDGASVRAGRLVEWLADSRELAKRGVAPQPALKHVLTVSPELAPRAVVRGGTAGLADACRDGCYAQWQACFDDCMQGGGGWLTGGADDRNPLPPSRIPNCAYCDAEYDACVSGCPPPPCEPTSSDFFVDQFVHHSPLWDVACVGIAVGTFYRDGILYWNRLHYRRTLNCDGSETVELLESVLLSTRCFRQSAPWTCSSPNGRVFPPWPCHL